MIHRSRQILVLFSAERLIPIVYQLKCFDLKNWLESNGTVNGGRWRCVVCENFLSYQDLELCAVTADLLVEFRNDLTPTARDRVEYCSDGSYTLLGYRKQRYGKKRSSGPDVTDSNPAAKKKSAPNPEQEIILLD